MVRYPTYAGPVGLEVILRARNFTGMHPTMQARVRALLEASEGSVGWGQGLRTAQQQLQLFLDRYAPDPDGPVRWNGQRYAMHKGPPAAPPGRSMHEIGLAADLTGDLDWLVANAGRFGLKTFADVLGEPWHVQPAELPDSRRAYEQQGSPWALPGEPAPASPDPTPATVPGSPVAPPAGSAPAATLTPALVARPGDTGPAAVVLIEALIAQGMLPDSPTTRTGVYAADHEPLVRRFQQDQGIGVDRTVGPETWGRLLAPVHPGDHGPMVRVLQTVLIVRGLIRDHDANRDGVYGPPTQGRVRDFQSVSGIDPIAVVGPQTWTALLGVRRRLRLRQRGIQATDDVIDLDDLDVRAALDGRPAG